MKIGILMGIVSLIFFSQFAHAQGYRGYNYNEDKDSGGDIPTRFALEKKEIRLYCAPFLPNQIGGITELMTLCGGGLAFKAGMRTFMELGAIGGAGHGQRYLMGSLSVRTDFGYDDIVASVLFGADVHYPTAPVIDPTTGFVTGEQTLIYFGGHVGGAIWAQISENFYFRTDMKFNFNPGTSLLIGFGIVLRFDHGVYGQDNDNLGPPR